jgi:hypothetical protein
VTTILSAPTPCAPRFLKNQKFGAALRSGTFIAVHKAGGKNKRTQT